MIFEEELQESINAGYHIIYIHYNPVGELTDILLRATINLFPATRRYIWYEENVICEYDSKFIVKEPKDRSVNGCIQFFISDPNNLKSGFLFIKNPSQSIHDDAFSSSLEKAFEAISVDENNKAIIVIVSLKQIDTTNLPKYVKLIEPSDLDLLDTLHRITPFHVQENSQDNSSTSSQLLYPFQNVIFNSEISYNTRDEMVNMSKIYDSICDELCVGVYSEKDNKYMRIRKKSIRDGFKPALRARFRFLITNIAHSNLSFYKINSKSVIVPRSDAAIIQMLITASVSGKDEDLYIENWFKGKYELLQEKHYDEIWALHFILKKRINELHQKGKVDKNTRDRWLSFIRERLNYDAIAACFFLRSDFNTLINSSRPLMPSFPYDIILNKGIDAAEYTKQKNELDKKIIDISSFLRTQEDYLSLVMQIIRLLNQAAIRQSEKVLEYAYKQAFPDEGRSDNQTNTPSDPNTILGTAITWNDLLKISLTHNPSLKPALSDNPLLKEMIAAISKTEYAEAEETNPVALQIAQQRKRKRRKRKKNRKQRNIN